MDQEYDYYEESYGSEETPPPSPPKKKSGWKSKLFGVFKKEEPKPQSKMPKKFAELVLEEELKIDRGNFDIETVNGLM